MHLTSKKKRRLALTAGALVAVGLAGCSKSEPESAANEVAVNTAVQQQNEQAIRSGGLLNKTQNTPGVQPPGSLLPPPPH